MASYRLSSLWSTYAPRLNSSNKDLYPLIVLYEVKLTVRTSGNYGILIESIRQTRPIIYLLTHSSGFHLDRLMRVLFSKISICHMLIDTYFIRITWVWREDVDARYFGRLEFIPFTRTAVRSCTRGSCTCSLECRSCDDEIQNRGKQKVAWEPVRATIGRCIYGAIPTLRRCRSTPTSCPPTDRPVYHRFRIYPGIPPSPWSARFDDMLSSVSQRWSRMHRVLNIFDSISRFARSANLDDVCDISMTWRMITDVPLKFLCGNFCLRIYVGNFRKFD